MRALLRPASVLIALFTLITGVLYPLAITGIVNLAFPSQAHGSVITRDDRAIGSRLVGQAFAGERYLIGRPSATSVVPYNAAASSGSNLGPTNPTLDSLVHARAADVRAREGLSESAPIPADLLTASGSGLDPHISPASAALQITRIARARGIAPDSVTAVIARASTGRLWGIVGEPRVNVLVVNLLLDGAPASSLGLP